MRVAVPNGLLIMIPYPLSASAAPKPLQFARFLLFGLLIFAFPRFAIGFTVIVRAIGIVLVG
jgi:hypothetical protein